MQSLLVRRNGIMFKCYFNSQGTPVQCGYAGFFFVWLLWGGFFCCCCWIVFWVCWGFFGWGFFCFYFILIFVYFVCLVFQFICWFIFVVLLVCFCFVIILVFSSYNIFLQTECRKKFVFTHFHLTYRNTLRIAQDVD